MAVGVKTLKAIIVVTLLLLPSVNVSAATVSDVYEIYDKELTSMYPESVLRTIADYQLYQRDTEMYKYVKKSEFDNELLKSKIRELEASLRSIGSKLTNAYDLELSEIYALEDEYTTVKEALGNARSSMHTGEVAYLDSANAPSEEEYKKALELKESVDSDTDIGLVPIKCPVSGSYEIKDKTDTHLMLDVDMNESVSPILNGIVLNISQDSVTVSHGSGLYSYYGGFNEILVKEGDAIYQGQNLGYSTDSMTFKFKIKNEIVDVSKLFREG